MFDRLPPHDIEAEEAVVAAAMVCPPDDLAMFVHLLEPGDFLREKHGWAWEAMQAIHGRGEVVNQVTVAHELARMGDGAEGSLLEQVGGATWLSELIRRLPTWQGVEFYARIVKRDAMYRRLLRAATDIQAMAYEAPPDFERVLQRAHELLLSVGGDELRSYSETAHELVTRPDGLGQVVEEHILDPRALRGLPTGLPSLDFLLKGWRPGAVYVFGAETSMGKSLFVQDRALALGKAGHGLLYFSTEMGNTEVGWRMVFQLAGIDPYRIERRGEYEEHERTLVRRAMERLAALPIVFCDRGDMSFSYLRNEVRRWRARQEVDVVVVDHIDMVGSGSGLNRTAELEEITSGLKALARDEGLVVFEVSHLSRQTDANRGSRLNRLRNSQSKSTDADVVMFLEPWQAVADERGGYAKVPLDPWLAKQRMAEQNWLNVDLVVEKQRHGKVGVVSLRLDWDRGGRFFQLEQGETA